MKKTYLAKLAIVGFTMAIAFAFMGTGAQAETGTISSTVSIATPITINSDSNLIFGTFTAPSTATDAWTINASTGALTFTGTDGVDIFTNDHHRGGFTINGENSAAITYSAVRTVDFTDAALSLTAVTLNPSAASNLNSSGVLVLTVGGTVAIGTAAVSGADVATIELTANY